MSDNRNDTNTDVTRLLKSEFGDHEGTFNWDRLDYMHAFGSDAGALLYSTLFVPQFIEIDGHVFLDQGRTDLEQRFKAGKEKPNWKGRTKELVEGFNYVELPFVFQDARFDLGELMVLAEIVAEAWRAYLFPHRRFSVVIDPPTAAEIGVDIRIREDDPPRAAEGGGHG